ncbi:MAG: ATP-binding cassette domain-containing protein [Gammaproteobacteria bacterium]|jgi:osmoprotectant transport system ATP-binding protein
MTDCVTFRGVSKSFVPGQRVLDDITLALPAGVTTAVVGESGSGKTTLLQLVNAVLEPDAGSIEIFGEPIPDDRVKFRRGIGYSVQGAGLFPHMTNRQNITLLARLEHWRDDAIERRFFELLEQMELDRDVADRYPMELSGGQQQRVGLCRSLMLKPKMLLLDEPFSAVDPITRVGIHKRFRTVQETEGVSTLLVTHDMREAVKLASFLVIVQDGAIAQAGSTDAVLRAPASPYVASLLEGQLG